MFDIKSANLPLVALLLKSADLHEVEAELKRRFGDIPDFFDDDAMVIDLSLVKDADIDFAALLKTLAPYRVKPIAIRGGSARQMRLATHEGLVRADDCVVRGGSPEVKAEAEVEPPKPPPSAMVVDKPLRSGQQVYARGRDLIVMSMVNAGAEVIADGHIHVYAPLRGKAIAGARGNAEARIITTVFEPQLVSIAGVYRTGEAPWPHELQGKAAQVRLVDDRLEFAGLA